MTWNPLAFLKTGCAWLWKECTRMSSLEKRVSMLEAILAERMPMDACPRCRERKFTVVESIPIKNGLNGIIVGAQRTKKCAACGYKEKDAESFSTMELR